MCRSEVMIKRPSFSNNEGSNHKPEKSISNSKNYPKGSGSVIIDGNNIQIPALRLSNEFIINKNNVEKLPIVKEELVLNSQKEGQVNNEDINELLSNFFNKQKV